MKTMKIGSLALLFMFLLASFPAVSGAGEVHLSAAASTRDVLKELSAAFTKANPGNTILTNLGASGALAKQIAEGAPADLFISANTKWMGYLVSERKIDKQTVASLAANSLVFVGLPTSRAKALTDLPKLNRIAMGSPNSVPAGQYAEETLRHSGVYQMLDQGKKLVLAKDVRQALLYADRGEVDGAFVYKTDALLARKAVILFTVSDHLHAPIYYPMGLTIAGKKNEAAQAFYEYLRSPAARAILDKFGFLTAPVAEEGH